MPSPVITNCIITGPAEQLAAFKERMIHPKLPTEGCGFKFDFESIIPVPEIVRGTIPGLDTDLGIEVLTGSPRPGPYGRGRTALNSPWVQELGISTIEGLQRYVEDKRPQAMIDGALALAIYRVTGCFDRYEWAVKHWGARWNAYELEMLYDRADMLRLRFKTAWSRPVPVLKALSKEYPDLRIRCEFFTDLWDIIDATDFVGGDEEMPVPLDVHSTAA